ncbi:hypothetical protein P153DRAFT_120063 [Dothidotthia symphoricarpi CBS 119687]|uniref:SET domain-containing protein n=1 Tax=Dothidotthia symphoricarpi CBS 119687 TaxID=1392245 RepID=A0A6A5ZZS9_9PLEO|nr:uncharacterized protein P153DRAFT_120063 [Dothidotthia symphoricarpi CBS 119687]KAF2125079.1 hypothetical protein P153DRAFT_120063 [Dothidotthia symphoricarpi CBS 119687]
MTDVSSAKAHADTQPASVAFYAGPPAPAYLNGSPPLHGTLDDDESSTIKCICGFSDDDGNTVLCEKCDTWQHIVCYYESAHHVPDVHECTDCLPRPVDSRSASEKQRLRREQLQALGERKGRPKSTTKNPKKRTKDPLGAVQPNGWAAHPNNDLQYNSERKSGSPRDQPPPNKRPKTSHRSSGSVSQAPALAPTSRKRGSSLAVNGHSPAKFLTNLDAPIEDFSSEFMHLCQQPDPPSTTGNSYTSIAVANDIATWLKDPDALAEVSGGKRPQDLFSRIEDTIEGIEVSAPTIFKQTEDNPSIVAHGLHPKWHYLTVETFVPENGYIGELKGLVGRKEDYFSDASNRWDLLRHPEPFVFFHPYLPIYIDTRQEGNILRFARRSCVPNMAIKILIEPSNDYHFCFLPTRGIDPGEELTVGWDIDSEIQKQLAKVVTNGAKEGFKRIQPWVSCVLANFGGCACDTSAGHECLLERARRTTVTESALQHKAKGRKSKKLQVSPLSTGYATNSRAGSETLHRDRDAAADDENMDSRSTSGSHKSSSRDITPATHFSLEGDSKMSNREKRKLQQQESLFEKLEIDEQHKSKKGKRNSAGSTLNTPGLMTSKRLGFSELSPTPRHREHSHGVARKTSGSSTKTNGRSAPKPKPVYQDASTQTNDNGNGAHSRHSPAQLRDMKPPMSFKRKLLQQAREDKLQRERMRSTSVKMEIKSPALKEVSPNKPSPLPPSPPMDESSAMDLSTDSTSDARSREPIPAKEPTPAPEPDVDMNDAETIAVPQAVEPKVEEMADAPVMEASSGTPHPPINPPAPPWPVSPPSQQSPTSTVNSPKRHVDFHVQMPPKFDPADPSATTYSMATPGSTTALVAGSSIAQSPSTFTAASPFSPAVNNAINPIPARKKLSLSDYTSRRARLAQSVSSGSAPSLAQSQSTTSPTLSTASLPNNNGSPPGKSIELQLSTVTEESKPIQSTATTSTPTVT